MTKKKSSKSVNYEKRLMQAKAAYNNDRLNKGVKNSIYYYIGQYRLNNCNKQPLISYFHDEISLEECHAKLNAAFKKKNAIDKKKALYTRIMEGVKGFENSEIRKDVDEALDNMIKGVLSLPADHGQSPITKDGVIIATHNKAFMKASQKNFFIPMRAVHKHHWSDVFFLPNVPNVGEWITIDDYFFDELKFDEDEHDYSPCWQVKAINYHITKDGDTYIVLDVENEEDVLATN